MLSGIQKQQNGHFNDNKVQCSALWGERERTQPVLCGMQDLSQLYQCEYLHLQNTVGKE